MSRTGAIHRLAIVNRGEAAMRCIRSVKALRTLEGSDLESIAIYTDVDRDAPFVRHADHALRLESPNGAVAAYLDRERLIELLLRARADAVWPGWGFVAEDPVFVDRLDAAGIRFLGPPGDVMRALGDKIDAKRIAEDAGIPVLAWSRGAVRDEQEAARWAAEIGYPLAVKAAAGGGGRGIRMVDSESELAAAFRSAAAEAKAAFGDDRLFIERKLPRGRHIEVQIAADALGSAVSLGCRDCSVQRRHQKLIEEAPPPGLPREIRDELERAAVRLVQFVGYLGVGTVEFLVVDRELAFLEVNPRLQVEHGITEELTGIDLVQLQIRIARGEALPERSDSAAVRVAIEARVCAEDPQADFLPTPGRIALFDPALGPRLRVDSGVAAGCRVPAEFDSLIAKLIATGRTREEARARLVCALTDFELVVAGGASNKGYLIDILETPEYREGRCDTQWLDRTPELRLGSDDYAVEALVAAAILSYQRSRDAARQKFYADPATLSPTSIPPSTGQRVDLTAGAESYRLEVFAVGAWRYRVHLDGRVAVATLSDERENSAILELGGRSLRVLHDVSERGLRIEIEAHPYRFTSELAGQVRSGTPAVVIGLQVALGDRVKAGQSLGLLEAMKSEIDFRAPVSGIVKEICVRTGQQVSSGELLLVIEAEAREGFESALRRRLAFAPEVDSLDLFFEAGGDEEIAVRDLEAVERAEPAARRAAIEAARDEIRRILMGYDVNPKRGARLVALLECPLPDGLSAEFRGELAEIRHELAIFADVEQLFVRAPHASVTGEVGPSNHARLRAYMRRMATEGTGMPEAFLAILRRALAHYGIPDLKACDSLERAVLRVVASQLSPDLRRQLVLGILRRVQALAESGVVLGGDERLRDSLSCISSLRGLVPDALADRAIEARYTIFEGPELERQAERTTREVEAWLADAELAPSPPPQAVLVHLANAPQNVFDRVGRWLSDPNPLRRSVAVAAQVSRFYAPNRPPTHTTHVIGSTYVERLEREDGRTLLGCVTRPDQVLQALERLARASREIGARRRIAAIELLVCGAEAAGAETLRDEIASALATNVNADRLTLTRIDGSAVNEHVSFVQTAQGWEEMKGLYGLHPETAERIDLHRLKAFDCERLDAPDDIYCFHLRSREIPGDERIFVLADFRGRSPEHGHEATLHLASFERIFFDAARTLRSHLGLRDPSRRLQWNRIAVFTSPAIFLDDPIAGRFARRLAPATRHLGLEKVIARLNVLDRAHPERPAKPLEVVIADPTGSNMELSWREPHLDPLEPARDYERKVVEARRRRLVYPYEIIRMLTGGSSNNGVAAKAAEPELPPGKFEEFDLAPASSEPTAVSVAGRPYGMNASSVVFGVIDTPTEKMPEGMRRVLVLSDPTIGMGALAAPECDRIVAAIDLAERLAIPLEWLPVSAGARIAMDSGTENLDATARVVRRIVTFTQAGGVIHIIVQGVNVGAQSYFNALATMLQHTRGALIMTASASMLLTGRAALEAAGAVSAEDETAIGGFERIMGPNGEAQFYARNLADAYRILYDHYRFTLIPPGESAPRPFATSDPDARSIVDYRCAPEEGHDFRRLGELFDPDTNLDRKRPFSMRALMSGVIDQDGGHLERWRAWQGAETAIVWDAHLGGMAVSLIGIESRSIAREGYSPSDGPSVWTGGTLFPLSSKKLARALNAASGSRPVVMLANLSGFDGSPESMRKLQLEYGAEIARAVVNFQGTILFLVVSRYHGGAYVVFSRSLNPGLRAAALSGSFASVIGGAPAAAVVFTREVRARAAMDPRIAKLRRESGASGRERLEAAWKEVLLEKQAELAAEFDAIHSVERAREVGSLEAIVKPEDMRSYLIGELRKAAAR